MGIIIRPAVTEDYKDIAELCGTSLGYSCDEALVKYRLSTLDRSREAVFAAQSETKVIGFVHAEKYEVLYFDTLANVLGIAVSDEYRRKGAGRMLMQAVEDWAHDIGAAGIRLNSGGSRKDAHEFYRAIGFDNEKTQIRFNKIFE